MIDESPYFERELFDGRLRYQRIRNTINPSLSDYIIEDIKLKVYYDPSPMMLSRLLNGLVVTPFRKSSPKKSLPVHSEMKGRKLKFQVIETPQVFLPKVKSEMCVKNLKTGEMFNPSPSNIAIVLNRGKFFPFFMVYL